MAVAVKTSPGSRSTGSLSSPALLSLLGVGYLLLCLVIVFKLIPGLWWEAGEQVGMSRAQWPFVGGALLVLVDLACAAALLVLGVRLLGPHPPAGVRAGVFVAFLGVLLVVLLTRWVGEWLEQWTYVSHWDPTWPKVVTAGVSVALLLGWVRLFFAGRTQRFVQSFEAGGWFHATAYKSNQGQKVRRGTIFGILLLVGAGIYTMLSHNVLGRGAPEWAIDVPFTGKVAVEYFGDAQQFIAGLPQEKKNKVMIRWPGEGTNFEVGQVVSFETYRRAALEAIKNAGLETPLTGKSDLATDEFLIQLNKTVFDPALKQVLNAKVFNEATTRRLESEVYDKTPYEDLADAVAAFYREANTNQRADLPQAFKVPDAVLVLDRLVMRDVNEQADEKNHVKVRFKGDSKLQEGAIVTRAAFDAEVDHLKAEQSKGRDRELPQYVALTPAWGPTEYAKVTLLPAVQFTVPLLLLAASLWLAWRVVNMPTFADFLIATEAELNKVSWTTQRRLVQDTIVVLVTVALMAVFLFGMDWTWKVVLSWRPIGVLHIPKESSQQNQKTEAKKW